jgi:hypothetical protein
MTHLSDSQISQLILQTIDRKLSVETLVEILESQLLSLPSSVVNRYYLHPTTVTAILEILSRRWESGSSTLRLLDYFSHYPQFPSFLSQGALVGVMCSLLRFLGGGGLKTHVLAPEALSTLVQMLAQETLGRIGNGQFTRGELESLQRAVQSPLLTQALFLPKVDSFQKLKHQLLSFVGTSSKTILSIPAVLSPRDTIATLMATSSDELWKLGVDHFKLSLELERTGWRVKNLTILEELLRNPELSPEKRCFLVQWFWTGALHFASQRESADPQWTARLCAKLLERDSLNLDVFKGMFSAIQLDYSQIYQQYLNANLIPGGMSVQNLRCDPEAALQQAQALFNIFVSLTQRFPADMSRQVIPWVLGLCVEPVDSRLLTRSQWQWIRALAGGIWEEDLKDCPMWVLAQSSRVAAQVFQMAPGAWIAEHCALFFHRLWIESQSQSFVATQTHTDYLEFLIRTARRKSPVMGSAPETLVALKIIGRLKSSEEQHLKLVETRAKLSRIQNWGSLIPRQSASLTVRAQFSHPELVDSSLQDLAVPALTRSLGLLTHFALSISKKHGTLLATPDSNWGSSSAPIPGKASALEMLKR